METYTRTGIRVGTWTELGTKWKKYKERTRDKDRGIGGTRSVEVVVARMISGFAVGLTYDLSYCIYLQTWMTGHIE